MRAVAAGWFLVIAACAARQKSGADAELEPCHDFLDDAQHVTPPMHYTLADVGVQRGTTAGEACVGLISWEDKRVFAATDLHQSIRCELHAFTDGHRTFACEAKIPTDISDEMRALGAKHAVAPAQ